MNNLKASPLPPAPLALLKCVLARWLLVARFLAFLRPDLRFMVPMGVIWHAWCLYFGVLEDPGTILGRSWGDLGTLEAVRSRLGYYRFFVDLDDPFCKLFGCFWTKKRNFFPMYFQMIFGSEFGCLGLQKQAFGMEGIAQIHFRRNWISYDFTVDFS